MLICAAPERVDGWILISPEIHLRQAHGHLRRRRLAAAAFADEGDDLALAHDERHVLRRRHADARVAVALRGEEGLVDVAECQADRLLARPWHGAIRPINRGGIEQLAGIGGARRAGDLARRSLLNESAAAQNGNMRRPVADDAEIVRHQKHGQVILPAHLVDEVEHFGLHRHVERCGRLVGDQEGRIAEQRQRDHDALIEPAGKLMRVNAETPSRLWNVDAPQGIDGTIAQLVDMRFRIIEAQRLKKLRADGAHRVQRGKRILEDHADRLAAEELSCFLSSDNTSAPLTRMRPLDLKRRRQQPHHRVTGDALAAARLADQGEIVAPVDLEGDVVDKRDRLGTLGTAKDDAEILNLADGLFRRIRCHLRKSSSRGFMRALSCRLAVSWHPRNTYRTKGTAPSRCSSSCRRRYPSCAGWSPADRCRRCPSCR